MFDLEMPSMTEEEESMRYEDNVDRWHAMSTTKMLVCKLNCKPGRHSSRNSLPM